jgi:hypothetical protein
VSALAGAHDDRLGYFGGVVAAKATLHCLSDALEHHLCATQHNLRVCLSFSGARFRLVLSFQPDDCGQAA